MTCDLPRLVLMTKLNPAAFWLSIGALWVAATVALCWSVLVLTGHAG